MFNRLYLKIYLALLASIVAAAAAMAIFHGVYDPDPARQGYDTLADFAGEVLPPAAAPADEQRRALRRWSRKMHSHMALYSAERELVADVGRPLPPLPPEHTANGRLRGNLTVFAFRLNDGRWLMVQRVHAGRLPIGVLGMLGIIALVVGLGAYPVVRRLTRRLERLQGSVEAWGGGNLASRVAVEGKDEVARLATSFNHSAERIEALVGAQKSLLANASHELRSPLARIRMAVELLQEEASPAIRDELKRNIAELDQLIDEVLLASRLDAMPGDGPAHGPVDFTGIVAEECAAGGAVLDAAALTLAGDARLLRRMVRNLIENARRYGGSGPIMVSLHSVDGQAQLKVCDSGAGVPEAERDRIFDPFYRLPGASEASGGVGLGLSLVRQIARHHKGEVACLGPQPGASGCCFLVSLPIS
ncbi:MAG: HAMP domain-containing sensor histidine kinase [Pseudomonadota bacterium]